MRPSLFTAKIPNCCGFAVCSSLEGSGCQWSTWGFPPDCRTRFISRFAIKTNGIRPVCSYFTRTLYWTFVQILRTELFIIFVLLLLVLPKIRITHFIVNIKLTPFHGVTRLRHGNVYASLKIVIAVSFAEPGANATFIK
jgi:hypothetical protein